MVSYKSLIGLAAFVVLAVYMPVTATDVSVDISACVDLCSGYMNECGDNLVSLLKNVLRNFGIYLSGLTGGLLNDLGDILSGLLGGVLNLLGIGSSKNMNINTYLGQPINKGSWIDTNAKCMMMLGKYYEKLCPELGYLLVKAYLCCCNYYVTGAGGVAGCTMFRQVSGGTQQVISQCNFQSLCQQFDDYKQKNQNCSGNQLIFISLCQNIFDLLNGILNGVDLDLNDLLGITLLNGYSILALYARLLGLDVTVLLGTMLDGHQKFGCGGNTDGYESQCISSLSQCSSSDFSGIFLTVSV